MRIGVFGGSFNPIHIGHAIMANYVSQLPEIDEVWLMPSRINPLKQDLIRPASGENRLAMCSIVAERCANVRVSDIEMHLPEPSFTYSTLCELKRQFPQHDFRLIIGSDNWTIFSQWRDWQKIISEFGLLIYMRPGYKENSVFPDNVRIIEDAPQVFVSSTMIREGIKDGRNVNFLLPLGVIEYIEEKGLYIN